MPFKERNLFLRQNAGKFEVTPLGEPGVYRGAAFGDIDKDGRIDVVVTANNGPALWYRNTGAPCATLPRRTAYSYLSASQ